VPCAAEGFDGAVFRLQPFPELGLGGRQWHSCMFPSFHTS
jgi:hypothetical protein